jgi:hypothetical protein
VEWGVRLFDLFAYMFAFWCSIAVVEVFDAALTLRWRTVASLAQHEDGVALCIAGLRVWVANAMQNHDQFLTALNVLPTGCV